MGQPPDWHQCAKARSVLCPPKERLAPNKVIVKIRDRLITTPGGLSLSSDLPGVRYRQNLAVPLSWLQYRDPADAFAFLAGATPVLTRTTQCSINAPGAVFELRRERPLIGDVPFSVDSDQDRFGNLQRCGGIRHASFC